MAGVLKLGEQLDQVLTATKSQLSGFAVEAGQVVVADVDSEGYLHGADGTTERHQSGTTTTLVVPCWYDHQRAAPATSPDPADADGGALARQPMRAAQADSHRPGPSLVRAGRMPDTGAGTGRQACQGPPARLTPHPMSPAHACLGCQERPPERPQSAPVPPRVGRAPGGHCGPHKAVWRQRQPVGI